MFLDAGRDFFRVARSMMAIDLLSTSVCRLMYLWVLILSLSYVVSAQQDLLSALSAQSSLTTFVSFLQQHESLITAAQSGNLTSKQSIPSCLPRKNHNS